MRFLGTNPQPANVRTVGCVGDALPQAGRRFSRPHLPREAFCPRGVLSMFSSISYRPGMPDDKLKPADPDDLARDIAFALRFEGRKRKRDADDSMASIAADRIVRHLERAYVILKKPPIGGTATLDPPPRWPHTKIEDLK